VFPLRLEGAKNEKSKDFDNFNKVIKLGLVNSGSIGSKTLNILQLKVKRISYYLQNYCSFQHKNYGIFV